MSHKIPRISGVYCIFNTATQKIYIGASNHVRKRFVRHFCVLQHTMHDCKPLQEAWSVEPISNFIFGILEECNGNRETLDRHEQFWLDAFSDKYNMCPYANRKDQGIWFRTFKKGKHVHSEEQKQKWSLERQGPLKGKRLLAHRRSMKRALKASIAAWADPIKRAKRIQSIRESRRAK